MNLRATIRDFVRTEVEDRDGVFRSENCDEAINAAFRTRNAVVCNRKTGKECRYSFRSIKNIRLRILIQKLNPRIVEQNYRLSEFMSHEA